MQSPDNCKRASKFVRQLRETRSSSGSSWLLSRSLDALGQDVFQDVSEKPMTSDEKSALSLHLDDIQSLTKHDRVARAPELHQTTLDDLLSQNPLFLPSGDVLEIQVPPTQLQLERSAMIHLPLDNLDNTHCLRVLHTGAFAGHLAVLWDASGIWAVVLLVDKAYRSGERLVQCVFPLGLPATPVQFDGQRPRAKYCNSVCESDIYIPVLSRTIQLVMSSKSSKSSKSSGFVLPPELHEDARSIKTLVGMLKCTSHYDTLVKSLLSPDAVILVQRYSKSTVM